MSKVLICKMYIETPLSAIVGVCVNRFAVTIRCNFRTSTPHPVRFSTYESRFMLPVAEDLRGMRSRPVSMRGWTHFKMDLRPSSAGCSFFFCLLSAASARLTLLRPL